MQIPAAIAIARRAISSASRPSSADQRPRRGERVTAARADADDPVLGFEHVAGARQDQRYASCRRPPSSPRGGADSGRSANPWPARRRRASNCPEYCSSLASSRSNRAIASAVAPAKPAITEPPTSRRNLRAFDLTTVWPIVTWPSPATTTWPPLRTHRIVVPCQSVAVEVIHALFRGAVMQALGTRED